MYRVCLINMPFSNLALPSIALTQLKSIAQARLGENASIELIYLSVDCAKYLGMDLYEYLTSSGESLNTGLGDWFFRQAAFPELPDNTENYFMRHFPAKTPAMLKLRNAIVEKRCGMEALLDQLISDYELDRADMVGLTSMFMQNVACFALARKLKARNQTLITVMGGANCEYPMGQVIVDRVKHIDFVFSGPALRNFPEFVKCCMDGDLAACSSIRGVLTKGSRTGNSIETIGEDLEINTPIDLDYEPFIEKLGSTFPNSGIRAVLPFETSRGCWWGERAHCTFCGLNGVSLSYRAMESGRAIREFKKLFSYSGRVAQLSAVDNILPRSYFQEVLPFLDTPPDMEIFYEVKASLSEEDAMSLAKARVNRIQPGIEALSTPTLKLMKKGTTVFQNLQLLKICALYDLTPNWNLLLGFPGETEEVYRRYVDMLPLLVHLPPPTGAYPVRFDRFSPYYDEAAKYGLDLHPLDFYSFIYPFEPNDLAQMAYYFRDCNLRAEYFIAMAKWIGKVRAKIDDWGNRWSGQKERPQLYWKDPQTIYDSRSGKAVEYPIEQSCKMLMSQIDKPKRIEELAKIFASGNQEDIATSISWLIEKGLVFHEGDRLFSLVLEAESGSKRKILTEFFPVSTRSSTPPPVCLG